MLKARWWMLGLAGISAALLLGASTATAEGEAAASPEGWAYKVPRDLMSPFCPGVTLSACTSPQADELRVTERAMRIRYDGTVSRDLNVSVRLSTQYDLRRFPFDHQQLTLEVEEDGDALPGAFDADAATP